MQKIDNLLHSFRKIFATYANKLILYFQKTAKAMMMMKLWPGFPVTFAHIGFTVAALKILHVHAAGVIIIEHLISLV